MADNLPPLTGNIAQDLPPLTGDPTKDLGPKPTPINPYAGPPVQGADDPGKLGRILAIARQNPLLSDQTKLSLAVPGAGSLLGRVGLQAGAQGAGALARGEGLGEAGKSAATGAVGQLVGEGLTTPLKLGLNAASLNAAKRGDTINKAFTETLSAADQQAHQALVQAKQDEVAKAAMSHLQQRVPALKSLPTDTKGLLDAVYGKGPELVSKEFDAAMKGAAGKAEGTLIEIPIEAANALKLKGQGAGMFSFPTGKATMTGGTPQGMPNFDVVKVDAAEAINAMLGKSLKEPAAYRAVAQALDDANLGDPAARQAYKTFRSMADYLDKVKGLKGEQAQPANILGGFTDRRTVDLLRRRGEGDIFTGPLQSARGLPPAPTPREAPPSLVTDQFKTIPNPLAGHPWIGGVGGGAAAHGLGMGVPGHVLGFTAGAAASNMMPRQLVTQAPLPPYQQGLLENLPSLMAALAAEARARAR